jgi:hypothetical protein
MTKSEKSAICRILFDLIQADQVIDSGEMEHYSFLRDKYSISREEEITASQITLSEAMNSLSMCAYELKESLLQDFSKMTVSDGFCARSEALLMIALSNKLLSEDTDVELISIPKPLFNIESASVLYIESRYEKFANEIINKNYRTIFKECQIAGFNFIYIPRVIEHYKQSDKKLISQIIHFLAPKYSEEAVETIIEGLFSMTTSSFCKDILCNKLGITELRDATPSLLVKIGQSYVGETIYSNYLKIEVEDDFMYVLQNKLDEFLSLLSSDVFSVHTAEEKQNQFLYHGFYKQLLDIFLVRKNIRSRLHIQPYTEEFLFPDIDEKLVKLHRREKALYLLLLVMSKEGGINFNQPKTAKQLVSYNRYLQRIQSKYQLIYEYLGGDNAPDLTLPEIRRPIISCLKKSLSKFENLLYNFKDYTISKDQYGTIKVNLEPEAIFLYVSSKGYVQLQKTELFSKILNI